MTSKQANSCEVAVIGAGPYGLSVAAHLREAGITTHVFGEPMGFWHHNMPKGMLMRSPWRATHLSDPAGALSLDVYAGERGIDSAVHLPLESFVAYGEWFAHHATPDVDRRVVQSVETSRNGFRLTLADGEIISADRVVVATGLRNQEYWPPSCRDLPGALVSHSSEHTDFAPWRGKRVAVLGRGQSACESAALLNEAGAETVLVARGDIRWLGMPKRAGTHKPLRHRLREAMASPSEVGPFPWSWLVEVPGVVRHMPADMRARFTQRCLTPAASGWLRPRFADITCIAAPLTGASADGGRITLAFADGAETFDHLVLGTGYHVDISRLGILADALLARIACAQGSPLLRGGFESSVPNLHFVGSYAVRSYGPLLRFIAGAPFAARAVTRAALRQAALRPVSAPRSAQVFGAATPNLSPPQ
jgi:cation diffusion facilitator CzcD-associated flavoprotein CzcO